ncbi:hypothetical protein WBP07_06880 [Novosphingobium sp. BL-8A]|uniref:hypothetical protein n=1 Tax=Novosphingobium sp. BL-8A TaxID=3127639 RepID=UPI003756FBE4
MTNAKAVSIQRESGIDKRFCWKGDFRLTMRQISANDRNRSRYQIRQKFLGLLNARKDW